MPAWGQNLSCIYPCVDGSVNRVLSGASWPLCAPFPHGRGGQDLCHALTPSCVMLSCNLRQKLQFYPPYSSNSVINLKWPLAVLPRVLRHFPGNLYFWFLLLAVAGFCLLVYIFLSVILLFHHSSGVCFILIRNCKDKDIRLINILFIFPYTLLSSA